MATQLINVNTTPYVSDLDLLYNGTIDDSGANSGRILHYISQVGHSNFTSNLVKMWFTLSESIVLNHFRMYNQHAIDDFTLSVASSATDESGTVIIDATGVAGTANSWTNYYSTTNTSSSQYYFLNITKWTSVQYFQIKEVEFYGNGPFVVGTIALVGDSSYNQSPNTPYVEPGYTIKNVNGDDVTSQYIVEITGSVDVNTIGEYTLTYTANLDTPYSSASTSVIRTVNVEIITIHTVEFNSSIAYIRRDELATLINSFVEVSSLKEIYNMWYNNTQITGGTDCWIYYAYSTVSNEVLYTSRKIQFLSKNDGTYEWIDNEVIVNATVTSNGLSAADLTDYTSFYSGLEPFNINMSSTSINRVNALLNNSGYSLYNYIQIFNIWYNETNAFDMDYDNTTREVDVWVYVLTDQTAMEDILDKHATPIEPITDFDEKQITIEMLKPYLLEGGNVKPIFETRKMKYTVKNNNASYTWTMYTNVTIESTINDTGYSIISSLDNYKLSYFYFDSYTIVRESSKEALRSVYLAYYNSTKKLKKINEVWYNKLTINSGTANDSEGPLITVLGQNPINIIQKSMSSYREIGVVAIDNADSDVTDQITATYTNKATNIIESTIDTSIVGEYIVTYTVQDNAGNVSTATRDLNILADTVGPVLTILGDNPTQIELGSITTYVDGGASAIDSIDGDITDQIVITNLNTVDLTTLGTYTITYTIEDSAGNIETKDRRVSVVASGGNITGEYFMKFAPPSGDVNVYYIIPTAVSTSNGISHGLLKFRFYGIDGNRMYVRLLTSSGGSQIDINFYFSTGTTGQGDYVIANIYNISPGIHEYQLEWNGSTQSHYLDRETNPTALFTTTHNLSNVGAIVFEQYAIWGGEGHYGNFIFKNEDNGESATINFQDYSTGSGQTDIQFISNKGIVFQAGDIYAEMVLISGGGDSGGASGGDSGGDSGGASGGASGGTPPTVTLNGDSVVDLFNYSYDDGSFVDEGATATDYNGNSLTVETTIHLQPSSLSTGIIAYTATDSTGNIGFNSRKINILPEHFPSTPTFEIIVDTRIVRFQKNNDAGYYRIIFSVGRNYDDYFNSENNKNGLLNQNIELIAYYNHSIQYKYEAQMSATESVHALLYISDSELGFTVNAVPQLTNYAADGYNLETWESGSGSGYQSTSFVHSVSVRWFLNMYPSASSNVSPVETLGIGWLKMPRPNNDGFIKLKSANGFSGNGISNGILKFNFYLMNRMYYNLGSSGSTSSWGRIIRVNIYTENGTNYYDNGTKIELYNIPFGSHEYQMEWNGNVQTHYIDRETNPIPVFTSTCNFSAKVGGLDIYYSGSDNVLKQDYYYGNIYIKDNDTGNEHLIDFNDYPSSIYQTVQQFCESKGLLPWSTSSSSPYNLNDVEIITTMRPVITLNGDSIIELYVGDTYTEQGASATLNNSPLYSGGLTSSGTVDTSTVGVYQIVYTARKYISSSQEYYEDAVVRIVNVKEIPDTEAPVIEIAGSNPVEIILGSAYVDEGATATDNIDGAVSVVTSGDTITETSEEGEYTITYTATDNAGNVSTATRTVIIISSQYLYSCFYMSTNASVVNDNGNKYLFNGDTNYNADKKYGLGVGTYTIKNIPAEHPMALLNEGKTHLITYTGDDAKKFSKSVTSTTADGTYDFYHGDITVTVLGNFKTLSIYCYYHGYMGGEKLLVYKEACEIGLPESLNINYTLGLYKSSNVVVNDSKYMFNGHTTYNSKYQYGLGTGTYTIKNIPEEHPMAILNAGRTLQISYSGDSTKKFSKSVTSTTADGTYDFYHGDIQITVNSNFDKVSVYCYYHGYMGGENLLVYSSDCKIQMPLIDSSSLSVAETSITTSDVGMKIYGKKKDYDENGDTITSNNNYNKLDVKYNKNTRKWNTITNIQPLLNVGSGLEDGLSSNNYFQIYHNIDYNLVQKMPELISKYNETYGEEISIDKFYESDEIDNAHILDCYMKFYLLSNPISELYTSLEYNRVINSWNVKNPTEVYNRVKASNAVKYSIFRLTHLNNKGDDLKEQYNIVYPLHSIIKIYKLWYNSSSAGDEIVDGIMFYSYKEKDDVLVKTQFATVNILYTVMTDTFSVMSETPTIRAYNYNGEDL